MFATGLGIVGRDEELAAIARFLDGGPEQAAYALLLEGEPGIGKSTVLQASLALARERDYRVLACAPASEETRLSFVGSRICSRRCSTSFSPTCPRRSAARWRSRS